MRLRSFGPRRQLARPYGPTHGKLSNTHTVRTYAQHYENTHAARLECSGNCTQMLVKSHDWTTQDSYGAEHRNPFDAEKFSHHNLQGLPLRTIQF